MWFNLIYWQVSSNLYTQCTTQKHDIHILMLSLHHHECLKCWFRYVPNSSSAHTACSNKHHHKRREENQLDATECFNAFIICSTCFRHLYARHQELETIFVLLPRMVCNVLVAGGWLLGAEQQAMRPGWGKYIKLSIVITRAINIGNDAC